MSKDFFFLKSNILKIMDGLRRFGISDNSRSFFAVKIIKGSTSSDKSDAGNRSLYQPYLDFLIEKVKGRQIQVANLTIEKLSDFKVIKKVSTVFIYTKCSLHSIFFQKQF